jgi:serine/threonine protein kinase
MIGQVVGKCRIDGLLGAGNMGVVYRGEHLALGVPVAVKTIKPELVQNSELKQRFLQEAQLAARLRHPNVVRVYDVGHEGDNHFIVMEFLDGLTLNEYFAQHQPLDLQTFLSLFYELASALGEAHRHGIIHRDVKPINVVVLEGPKAVLTDFGIAAALTVDSRLTSPGILMGTPAYMSPEQARGGLEIDSRTDVFSLGVMMYEVLAGALPQNSENVLEVIHQRTSQDIPSLNSIGANVPPALEQVITAAVSRDREARYADGTDLANAIAFAYQTIFPSAVQQPAQQKKEGPERMLELPTEETEPIAWGVDLRYTDLGALLVAVEQSSTGYGVVTIHYPQWADLLMFANGALEMAFRWRAEDVDVVEYDQVLQTYRAATQGVVDSRAVSERYYNALRALCMGQPTIGGMRLAFTDFNALVSYLLETHQSGVLRLQLGHQLGMVLVRDGAISDLFCSAWCQANAVDPQASITSLASLLRSHPLTRLDFYALDAGALRTQEMPVVDQPFEYADAEALVAFVSQAMRSSGEALGKQFGLGSGPILDKYLNNAVDAHPEVLEEVQYDEHKSPLPESLLGQIDRLPRTGRRQTVLDALITLLTERGRAVQDTLPAKRKRKKVMQSYLDVWNQHLPGLASQGLAEPFKPLFRELAP